MVGRIRLPPEIAYAVTGLVALYTVVAALLDFPVLLGLPAEWLLVLGMAAVATALGFVIVGQRRELSWLRAAQDEGAQAFRQRLEEGNAVGATLRRWPRISPPDGGTMAARRAATKAAENERAAGYKQAAAEWNAACRSTVEKYLPERLPDFDRPIVYSNAYASPPPKLVHRLREEWEQRYQRMVDFRDEYEARLGHR